MKILWISTSPRPFEEKILGFNVSKISSGGWIDAAYKEILCEDSHVDVCFGCASKKIKKGKVISKTDNGITVYCTHLPRISFGKSGGPKAIKAWKKILSMAKPDVIHLWGCEFSPAYDVVCAADFKIPVVLFTQGIVGLQSHYFLGNMSREDRKSFGIKAFFPLIKAKGKRHFFKKQVNLENFVIAHSSVVVTDNFYTKTYYSLINPNLIFKDHLEPLNEAFLKNRWAMSNITPHSIFTVFGSDLDKGLFQLLKAIVIVKQRFPDVQVIFPGPYPLGPSGCLDKTKKSLFIIWVTSFIKKNRLENNVLFPGLLSAQEMCSHLLKCNVFVNPSCMEVQSSSLREAMLLGVPSISSVCGSVLEFGKHLDNCLLYRYEEYEMLAGEIIALFSNKDLLVNIANHAYTSMHALYGAGINNNRWVDIYKTILTNQLQKKE